MDMGVGCDCFLLLDCNLAAAATGVEVDKEDDDDFRDRFRLLFGEVWVQIGGDPCKKCDRRHVGFLKGSSQVVGKCCTFTFMSRYL